MRKILLLTMLLLSGIKPSHSQSVVRQLEGTEKYQISMGNVAMTIDPTQGAKILSLTYNGQEVISQSRWPESFGSTFWTSPQKEWNWPPVPEFDKKQYEVSQTGNKLMMKSQVSERLPFRIGKEFSADETDNAIIVNYSITNEGTEARKVAPWEITRVPNEGLIFFDALTDSIWPAGLMPFTSAHGISWYQTDATERNRKVNADGKGWLAYLNKGLLLIKRFEDLEPSQPAPEEAEIQVYVNRGKTYIELESQGAYTLLRPGESLHWTVRWYLTPCQLDENPSEELVEKTRQK